VGEQQIILKHIREPVGCSPLKKIAKGKKRVLIVTDDNTRQTPLKNILPIVVDELKKAGVRDNQIKILVASGTHRSMTDKELKHKFGTKIVSRFKIYNHTWNRRSALARISSSIDGKIIHINRLAVDSDFIIGVGSIVPHATTGFSGGGKIILPGICGEETTEEMHWKALEFEMKDILGIYDNPMREMVDAVAKKAGLKFIVNVVLDKSNKIVDVVAGDPVKAHRKGVAIVKEVFGLRISHSADIVVADAKPMDIDLRQAIKAVAAADIVVRKGGVIVLNARCPEGVSPQFPQFEKYGFRDPDGLKRRIEEGSIKGKVMAYTLIAIGRILKYKARVILVSRGISPYTAQKLGFLWARSVKEALRKARELTRKKAKTIFLRRACEALPLID
jgi:nickel-dependent lactate racemase